jgi:hypothetical protein
LAFGVGIVKTMINLERFYMLLDEESEKIYIHAVGVPKIVQWLKTLIYKIKTNYKFLDR